MPCHAICVNILEIFMYVKYGYINFPKIMLIITETKRNEIRRDHVK